MGNDTPLGISDRPQLLYNYFKQLFAQVPTALDGIREDYGYQFTIGGDYNCLVL
jgi:hypothetical protein